ncbi:MAG: ATP-dependent DNA helicase RecG [Putridiphycobacter sp.]|nr:ATP-dependent DNA helicase RecG [Putridiphycobacter sp.]
MLSSFLDTPIEYLKGVGPQKGEVLRKELGIFKFRDLLLYFPFRYVDRSTYQSVGQVSSYEGYMQLKGTISKLAEVGKGRGKRLTAQFKDETGQIELTWFKGANFIKSWLKPNTEYRLYGKPKKYGLKYSIAHPELEIVEEIKGQELGLQPVYHSSEKLSKRGLHSKGIASLVNTLLHEIKGEIPDPLPAWLIKELNLISRHKGLTQIHLPANIDEAKKAQLRVKFDELFFLQLELLTRKKITQTKINGYTFPEIGKPFNEFFENHLPFELTNAQKRVVREIRKDMAGGKHMNRLLQGDVGSGKTLVALLTALIAIGNGYQTCIMAPTEILANQHFETFKAFLKGMPINVALLTGSSKSAARKVLHEKLESGEIDILVGTHALIEHKVKYKNLGLAIIDEQHRFGVAQRSKLWQKNTKPPHILVMTATPIPRTLALTFYGDLDVSVIDELPPGRKAIETRHYFESSRLKVFKFIESEIKKGRQVYIVYPLIEESEKLDYANLMAGYESIERRFPRPDYQVSIVHGRMKAEDKDYEMQQFANGITNIMVATTVIEVGVNVPNASIMIIESAEKFGLSQLHQLRGRVGRGASQSYCVLMTGYKLGENAKKRMETMVSTNDGFELSEVDLKLRGPGDIMGTKQSGILDLKIADLAKDGQIVSLARDKARQLFEIDPKLEQPEHRTIAEILRGIIKNKPNWSRIS